MMLIWGAATLFVENWSALRRNGFPSIETASLDSWLCLGNCKGIGGLGLYHKQIPVAWTKIIEHSRNKLVHERLFVKGACT